MELEAGETRSKNVARSMLEEVALRWLDRRGRKVE
jgi:hypothetical protein